MAQCDVCSKPGQGHVVKAHAMSSAVKGGFNPYKAGLAPDMASVAGMGSSYDAWRQSAINGVLGTILTVVARDAGGEVETCGKAKGGARCLIVPLASHTKSGIRPSRSFSM